MILILIITCPDKQQYDRLDQIDHNDTDDFDHSNSYSEGEDFDFQEYDEDEQDENQGLYVTLKTYEGKKSKNSINF